MIFRAITAALTPVWPLQIADGRIVATRTVKPGCWKQTPMFVDWWEPMLTGKSVCFGLSAHAGYHAADKTMWTLLILQPLLNSPAWTNMPAPRLLWKGRKKNTPTATQGWMHMKGWGCFFLLLKNVQIQQWIDLASVVWVTETDTLLSPPLLS